MSNEFDSSDIRQEMIAQDMHYHAKRLGFGGHGTHEGWTQVEEAGAAAKAVIKAEAREHMIAVAAYYLAEKRGFAGNGCDEDWTQAAAEIDALMGDRG